MGAGRRVATVNIGKTESAAPLDCPHVSYVEGYIESDWNNLDGWRGKTLERVDYLARRRNGAMKELVRQYPDTTDVFMIDSYYLHQKTELNALLIDYLSASDIDGDIMMGGSTWFQSYIWPYHRKVFWDTWTTPECRDLKISENRTLPVKAIGGVILFPIAEWKKHPFDNSAFPDGCEMNGFCNHSTIPKILNSYRKFHHPNPKRYSFVKSVRVISGKYRRKIWS